MAAFATSRKTLLVGSVVMLAVMSVVVLAVEEAEVVVETQQDKKGTQDGDSKFASSRAAPGSSAPGTTNQDMSSIDNLLDQSSKTSDNLDSASSKERIFKYVTLGMGALVGLGGLAGLANAGYYGRKSSPAFAGKGAGLNVAAATATLLGIGGAAVALWQRRKAQERAKTYARELLAQRQAMLSKLSSLEEPELEDVLGRAEEIGNIADEMGMFVPDIGDSVPRPPEEN